MALYKEYADTKAVGYITLNNFGGLEILAVNDDEVVACFNFGTGRQQIRRHKIQYSTSGRCYIRKQGTRYYFDQMMAI